MALRKVLPPDANRLKVDNSFFIVNIVLLLILFFLATGQLLNSPSFGVELSETEELPVEILPSPLLIVNADGSLSLDGEPIAPELLGPALANQSRVHLLIPKDSPATQLIDLLARPELSTVEVKLVTIHYRGEAE
ncbi:biopolymer transporter ExbD [Loktanella sp. IMCC34160]|uniref:biopolymer transporter ExbD n=1 Tax=Loktanella sp. IMCC34160 TaxID=2510646 RepID=UPI00101BA4C1|nr:biopolymer transporter ExbD [Loktanella sp. IMCC34160]RYG91412.1 biopolymer transporter ExbD [Loktanella sp. IMCC34160]